MHDFPKKNLVEIDPWDPQEKKRLTELAAELQTLQDLFSKVKGELLPTTVDRLHSWPFGKVRV